MLPIIVLPNFKQNLETIEQFWTVCQLPKQHLKLVSEIGNTLYVNLEGFPQIGRRFIADTSDDQHIQTRALVLLARARATLNGVEIREYLLGDYLVLYGVDELRIYLIAIKHHKQAGFSIGAL
jgi:hypothetical protein